MSLVCTANAATPGARRHSLYIGGKDQAKSLPKLEQWGISHILNVTPTKDSGIQAGVPNYFEKSKQFVYQRVAVYDASTSATELESQAENIVNFISKGLHHGSVLVHCNHGVSRSTTCIILYLMRKMELTLEDALTLVKRRRPEAQPIPAFMKILQRQEQALAKKRKTISESDSCNLQIKNKKKRTRTIGGTSMGSPTKGPIGPSRGPTKEPSIGPPRGPSIGPSIGPEPPNVTKDEPSTAVVDIRKDADASKPAI